MSETAVDAGLSFACVARGDGPGTRRRAVAVCASVAVDAEGLREMLRQARRRTGPWRWRPTASAATS